MIVVDNLDIKLQYRTKSFLYKVYARTSLSYSLENVYFSPTILKTITTNESNLIKRILCVSKYSSTTKIMRALNIPKFDTYLKKRKLNFAKQLSKNTTTRAILAELYNKDNDKNIISEIVESYLNKPTPPHTNLTELLQIIDDELKSIKEKEKTNETETDEDVTIRYLLDNRNKANNAILHNILKPENNIT